VKYYSGLQHWLLKQPELNGQIVVVNKQELFAQPYQGSGVFDVTIRHEDGSATRIYNRNKGNEYGWAMKIDEREQIRDRIVQELKEREEQVNIQTSVAAQ
jgi:hypothetical protein